MAPQPAFLRVRAAGKGHVVDGAPAVKLGGTDAQAGAGTAFARWTWDGCRLRLEVDRYGAYPVFYEAGAGEIAISTSLPRLLELERARHPDFEALSVFLRLGFFCEEDTPFREIRVMPPGGVLEWSRDGLEISAPPLPTYRSAEIDRREAMHEYQRLFADAVRRCDVPRDARVAVPVSGGRDSRHILLELCEQGRKPTYAVTALHFPPRPNEDAAVATELCRFLDVPLRVAPQGPSMFHAELAKNLATSFCADEHGWLMAMAHSLDSDMPDCLFDGLAGDVLSAGLFVTSQLSKAFAGRDAASIARVLLRHPPCERGFGEEALSRAGAWRLLADVDRDRAQARLARAVERHLDAPNPVASFFFWNRTRRETALSPFALLGGKSLVYTPYLDHRLFDFLSSLPLHLVEDQSLHTDTIALAYPNAHPIRYEDKGAPASDTTGPYLQFARELAMWDVVRRPSPWVRPGARLRLFASALGSRASVVAEREGRMYCYLSQLGRHAARAHS